MSWFSIEHRGGGAAGVLIRNEIGVGASVERFLAELGAPTRIELFVNSGGGCSGTAFTAYQALRSLGAPIEATIFRGFSAALIFACAADRIRILQTGRVMVHKCSLAVFGDREHLAAEADRLAAFDAQYQAILAERCKLPLDEIAGWFRGGDKYFTAEEALAAGLVDGILPDPPPCVPTASSPSVEDARPPAPARTEKETLLRELLKALGPVETADLAALRRDLGVWLAYSVRPISPDFKEEHPIGPVEPISSSAGLSS